MNPAPQFTDYEARVKLANAVLDVYRFCSGTESGDDFIEIASAILTEDESQYSRRVELWLNDEIQSDALFLLSETFLDEHEVWNFIRTMTEKDA